MTLDRKKMRERMAKTAQGIDRYEALLLFCEMDELEERVRELTRISLRGTSNASVWSARQNQRERPNASVDGGRLIGKGWQLRKYDICWRHMCEIERGYNSRYCPKCTDEDRARTDAIIAAFKRRQKELIEGK